MATEERAEPAVGADMGPTGTNEDLRVEDLTKTFGDEVAVENFSTVIRKGEIKTLLGPSGCGKTTTLRCISGLERPDSGRIYIGGKLVSDPENSVHVKPADRQIGMVFQSSSIWPHMNVRENILFPLKVRKIGTKETREAKLEEIMEIIDLQGYEESLASTLSGGQKQRVNIARALITEPKVLLFDEPLSSLDAKLARNMRREIKKIQQDLNITTVYVTHDQEEAMYISDSIALMNDGHIVEENDPISIYESPSEPFSMNFIGHSNNIKGEIASNSDPMVIKTDVGEFEVSSDDRPSLSSKGRGDVVHVAFRPTHCHLSPSEPEADGTSLTFEATVRHKIMVQDFAEYDIESNGVEVTVRSFDKQQFEIGDPVFATIGTDDIKVFDEAKLNDWT